MKTLILAALAASVSFATIPTAFAQTEKVASTETEKAAREDGKVEAGVLRCEVEGGLGLLIGSSKGVACVFEGIDGVNETYTGRITKLGLDVGVTGKQTMVWRVLAPQDADATSSMGGRYVGASAGASVGVGGAANALIGGSDENFVLQPISLQTGTGVNVALGVAAMRLEATN